MWNSNLFSREEHPTTQTILVVEDNSCIGMLLVEVIHEETPYKAILVTDGKQALQLTRSLTPDLFLLDYHLPFMSGLELYDSLHAMKKFSETPALFMSANIPIRELEKRHVCFINKPFELDDMINTIEGLLSRAVVAVTV
ncbi:response regulator [Ktedonobacter racemifer]|uniref:Response regulator receiver protein n=1 Tax=Ktedonobacter racemifer DSM 44963 TaxID=485913 RepID=D6TCI5_KTERA|nr:response regulator [Ktedonobacter racemifer]EFH90002.1 response regulator receiver protein [Ktedonobacter racemifer DSM 44963]